jgi:hypothetical protein
MKKTIIFLLLSAPLFAGAQSITYGIEEIKQDSFYLVETITAQETPQSPRPSTQTNYILFRSAKELDKFVEGLNDAADKQDAEAEKIARSALQLRSRSQVIEELASKRKRT